MTMIAQETGSLVLDTIQNLRLDVALKLFTAVLLGGAIGLERQIAGKPAGLRTNILICVGSALLMDLSIKLSGLPGHTSDPARLAAQVVTGVGFLGAGTIMQARGTISGLTSAATIWTVAAIGLTIGAGFYVEGLGATAMVMLVLIVLGMLEHKLVRARRTSTVTLRTQVGTDWVPVELLLKDSGMRVIEKTVYDHARDRVFELRLRGPAPQFDVVRESLMEREDVLDVTIH